MTCWPPLKFRVDQVIKGRAYPALARHQARPYTQAWREFGQHWPYTTPAELFGHLDDHAVPYDLVTQQDGIYVIGLGFFDFDIDYLALIPDHTMSDIRRDLVRVLFYYHEGDNPHKIKYRLDKLCERHRLHPGCYRFVSGNTAAKHIENFAWFPDHELLYWRRNQSQPPTAQRTGARPCEFTVLSRTHKWWRASIMAELQQTGCLDRSIWSYNTELVLGDDPRDNPIQHQSGVDVAAFMRQGPYVCDQLSQTQHNDHSLVVADHFVNSYCSIVLETHFDADHSGGAFLTEKTFKCLKHGHPFVIAGTAGSLDTLRQLGYRTFDNVIDPTYNSWADNTKRWQATRSVVQHLQSMNLENVYADCWSDIQHNQQLFVASKAQRLNTLFAELNL